MTLRDQIISDYRERVALNPDIPSELRRSLNTHERVPVFVDNLLNEIRKFPKNIKLDRMKLKSLVYSMTDVFILAVKTVAENRYKTDIEKEMIRQACADKFNLDKDGNGLIEELGVEVRDGQV
jgi:hypothetical protein